ncbi:sensor histidine kinase [Streptomyces sp. NPDC018833]|uniref:sensor histidine kinase n=1 Tax=Streptomyces sp. NPDC018833 TaxID=3365053 RepID=UPI00379862F0
MIARLRALPLRSRLALLVATAVALAVAVVSTVCWVVVRGKLYDEVDDKLHSVSENTPPLRAIDIAATLGSCARETADPAEFQGPRSDYYFQFARADDDRPCVFAKNSAGTVQVTAADRDVARAGDPTVETYRDGTDTEGRSVRVLTVAAVADGPAGGVGGVVQDTAVMYAFPLKEMENTLRELALLLLVVSGVGVFGAGAAGLWIARTGLAPVDRLTGAVEHVARTEDLSVRIPAEGNDEIARLSRSFNAMTAALASSRDLQQQLIADAGHELRTPLTSLRTNIELLARSEETGRAIPPEDRRALLASVKAQMTELASLIGDLQELSRPDSGAHGRQVQVVALHEIVDGALERARLRGPELTLEADVRPWYVRGEQASLERALVNVLDNAVKFSPPGGVVQVGLRDGELTVRDHGPGMGAEELPHVFERFWRSPSARSLPGSGLGLSIVARTVRQAGGEVALAPAEGGGTVAVIRLPGASTPPPSTVR